MHRRHAFSLVELSIVLVILGLLVGGVLSGQSLIRASELRSVAEDLQRYNTATQSFRDKYSALPGDMTNATTFWSSAGGTGSDATCQAVVSTTTATCNGDGNGLVTDANFATNPVEATRFWQHLANAGLIEGHYTGAFSGGSPLVYGTNAPRSKISNSGYIITSYNYAGDTGYYKANIGNTFRYGVSGNALKPADAWNIDTKMDDGKPATGQMIAVDVTYTGWNGTGCTSSTSFSDTTGTYNVALSSQLCGLLYGNL